jgi:hypothetical protein
MMPAVETQKNTGKAALVTAAVAASLGCADPAFAVIGGPDSYRFTTDELSSLTYE